MKLPWISRADRRRWKAARTLVDLATLTAGWLDGTGVRSLPDYAPNWGPDGETVPLLPVLARLNRAGMLTTCSQPGQDEGPGWDGALYRQRAAVDLLMAPGGLADRLLATARQNGLLVAVHEAGARGEVDGIPATERDQETVTGFGNHLSRRTLRHIWQAGSVITGEAFDHVAAALQIAVVAPEYGDAGNRLWEVLDDFAAAAEDDRGSTAA